VNKIGILIADDHPVVRQGIISFLDVCGEFEITGEAADGAEAVKLTQELRPDVVLMDLVMPVMDGIEAIRQIKKLRPETRIIALTSFAEDNKIWSAIQAGAEGYLLKGVSPTDLVEAIKSVHNGAAAVHPDIAKKLLLHVSGRDRMGSAETLTPRELEVLELISEGLSNEEIANKLFVSLHTVKTHVHNILHKLGMTHRVQAALYMANRNKNSGDTNSAISQVERDEAASTGL